MVTTKYNNRNQSCLGKNVYYFIHSLLRSIGLITQYYGPYMVSIDKKYCADGNRIIRKLINEISSLNVTNNNFQYF